MATKGTRTAPTADQLKAKLAKAKEALKALERRAFAGEITEAIKKSNLQNVSQKRNKLCHVSQAKQLKSKSMS